MKSKIFFLILFSFSIIIVPQNKSKLIIDKDDLVTFDKMEIFVNKIDSLTKVINEQGIEIQKLNIEKRYFDYLLQDKTSFYTFLISVILALAGTISLAYFFTQIKKIRKTQRIVNKQKDKIEELSEIQCKDRSESYYYYANICSILGGLEMDDKYANYNKSFYYYMRAIKYLLLSKRYDGISDILTNAHLALDFAKKSSIVSSQDLKLEERHISEILSTCSKLKNDSNINLTDSIDLLIKRFESNIDKLRG